jgi:hypothetical protein
MGTSEYDKLITIAKQIDSIAPKEWLPPDEGKTAKSQNIVYLPLVKGTRSYIEKIANQINGCYENGWFDACAVMIRRLLETLIIEFFERHGISDKIKKNGDFMFLRDMINVILNENSLNLSRNTKSALPKLKDIGDKSAHSRRFNAVRQDIDDIKTDLRVVIQELLVLARLK